jgi:hypothetical protein
MSWPKRDKSASKQWMFRRREFDLPYLRNAVQNTVAHRIKRILHEFTLRYRKYCPNSGLTRLSYKNYSNVNSAERKLAKPISQSQDIILLAIDFEAFDDRLLPV